MKQSRMKELGLIVSLIPRHLIAELVVFTAFSVFCLSIWFSYNVSPIHKDYKINLSLKGSEGSPILAGSAIVDITPLIEDTWEDVDHDGVYNRWKDKWYDNNNNGKFDAYWMAGYERSKPATSTFEPLNARAVILKKGGLSIGLVTIDTIGIFYEETVTSRLKLTKELNLDHLIIAAIHCHSAPDTIGYWSPEGIDPTYITFIRRKIKEALFAAKANISPCQIKVASVDVSDQMTDTRVPPYKVVPSLTGLELISENKANGDIHSTLLTFAGCHPTLLGRNSNQFSSDWVGFFRKYMEQSSVEKEHCIFFNGAEGGQVIPDAPEGHTPFHERVISAKKIASVMSQRLRDSLDKATPISSVDSILGIKARTIFIPIENKTLWLAIGIGYFGRGTFFPMKIRTETGILEIGPLRAATIPGEMFPEQFAGGEVNPFGADFSSSPVEVPPMKQIIGGDFPVVIGLANDEAGYIVPYSQWDVKKPHLDHRPESYGHEKLSLGPETARYIHTSIEEQSETHYTVK